MPERLIQLVTELKSNEYALNFTGNKITLKETGKGLQSALREKFSTAVKLIHIKKDEVVQKKKESQIKVLDEYFLFLRQFMVALDVDWQHPEIMFNSYPISVDESAKLIKIHYLFQMLGVDSMFVSRQGELTGRLKLESFLNIKYKSK